METCFFSVILSFEEDFKKYSRKKKEYSRVLIGNASLALDATPPLPVSLISRKCLGSV